MARTITWGCTLDPSDPLTDSLMDTIGGARLVWRGRKFLDSFLALEYHHDTLPLKQPFLLRPDACPDIHLCKSPICHFP